MIQKGFAGNFQTGYFWNMEQAYIIARLKEITIPELLDAIAEANNGEAIDIYEYLDPELIEAFHTISGL